MEEEGDDVALSRSMLVPFRNPTPPHDGADPSSVHRRQLAVVVPTTSEITTTTTSTSFPRFKVPRGWHVKSVLRADGSRSDRYYHEPGTGKKFRSTKEVERYLTGVEYTRQSWSRPRSDKPFTLGQMSSGSTKMIVSGGMLLRLDKKEYSGRQLVVAPTVAAATTPFNLPDGWVVEEVPRKCNGGFDKYYYEPGTGRKFRSLVSVQRYLAEVGEDAPLSQYFKVANHFKLLQLDKREYSRRQLVVVPTVAAATTPFNLPDAWVVEEVPRKCNTNAWFDKYYYEPGTGRKFRSLVSVQRYLAEVGEDAPLFQLFKSANRFKKFGLHKNISSGKFKISTSDIPKPPEKINWVLADPRGSTWNPFIGGSMIPEPIKQRWANRCTIAINEINSPAQFVE